MPKIYLNKFTMTPEHKKRFKMWLFMNNLTIRSFAKNCGVSRQYISGVLDGLYPVTDKVVETFEKGGYTIKQ